MKTDVHWPVAYVFEEDSVPVACIYELLSA